LEEELSPINKLEMVRLKELPMELFLDLELWCFRSFEENLTERADPLVEIEEWGLCSKFTSSPVLSSGSTGL